MKMDDDWGYLHDFEENTIRLEADFVQRFGVFGQLLSEMFELSLDLIFTRNFSDSLDFSTNMLDCSGLILDFSIKRLDLKQILLSSTHCPSTSWIKELYLCLSSTHCHSIFTRSHRRIFQFPIKSAPQISSLFITFCHLSSLFITFHHFSSLFVTCHHFSLLFITFHHFLSLVITFHHFSSIFVTFCHLSSLFIAFHHFSSIPRGLFHGISGKKKVPDDPFLANAFAAPSAQQQLNVGAGKWAPRVIAGDQVFPDPKCGTEMGERTELT